MIRVACLIGFITLNFLMLAYAQPDRRDYKWVLWNERSYKANYLKPFGELAIIVKSNGFSTDSIKFILFGKEFLINGDELKDVASLQEPTVTISQKNILNIDIIYGVPERVKLLDICTREKDCYAWIRPSINVSFYENEEMVVKYTKASDLLEIIDN